MSLYDKKYLLDGVCISAKGLIEKAVNIDKEFKDNWMRSTSTAAMILRKRGYTVEENPDFKE